MTEPDYEPVLDKGYVRVENFYLGGDLNIVNAARVSHKDKSKELRQRDVRLMNFLWDNDHSSPYRHAFITFEVKAPLMVARQWWKYVVGSDHTMDAWNEVSRRYVTVDTEFYIPDEWRSAPENKKQGSGDVMEWDYGLTELLKQHVTEGQGLYESALRYGAAPEQARLFLAGNALYTQWMWSCSVQSLLHFLEQRMDSHAQWEIQQYASAVYKLATPLFPIAMSELGSMRKKYREYMEMKALFEEHPELEREYARAAG